MEKPKKIPKKRGRKPKGLINDYKKEPKVKNNSDEVQIICGLPIKMEDLISNSSEEQMKENSLFIKSEKQLLNIDDKIDTEKHKTEQELLLTQIEELKTEIKRLHGIGETSVVTSSFDNNTKCWWCKNTFNTPAIGLPENYFKEKFICMGHFCSYNCALSYNLDINDEKVWKRNSLLYLLYKKSYNKEIKITPAPNWRILKEFGGSLSINEFRDSLFINTEEYTFLHPPITSQYCQIEKKYRVNKKLKTSTVKNIPFFANSSDDLVLKRNKPLKSSKFNLENTMGLKRKKKKNKSTNS